MTYHLTQVLKSVIIIIWNFQLVSSIKFINLNSSDRFTQSQLDWFCRSKIQSAPIKIIWNHISFDYESEQPDKEISNSISSQYQKRKNMRVKEIFFFSRSKDFLTFVDLEIRNLKNIFFCWRICPIQSESKLKSKLSPN